MGGAHAVLHARATTRAHGVYKKAMCGRSRKPKTVMDSERKRWDRNKSQVWILCLTEAGPGRRASSRPSSGLAGQVCASTKTVASRRQPAIEPLSWETEPAERTAATSAGVTKTPARLAGRGVDLAAADVEEAAALARPGHLAKQV